MPAACGGVDDIVLLTQTNLGVAFMLHALCHHTVTLRASVRILLHTLFLVWCSQTLVCFGRQAGTSGASAVRDLLRVLPGILTLIDQDDQVAGARVQGSAPSVQ